MSNYSITRASMVSRFGEKLKQRIRMFSGAETGTVTVESVMILPLLFFGVMATFGYFDAYRKQSLALKANYAVADFLSRNYKFTPTTLAGLDDLFQYMSKTGDSSWVRVTIVECPTDKTLAQCNDAEPRQLELWGNQTSGTATGIVEHSVTTMREFLGPHIPKMYVGEKLFIVESVAKYKPLFPGRWTGIYSRDFEHIVVTGTREYDDLCYEESTGDCPAPAGV
ncbi:TadE/TadG family type IV pilus assembly protein [Aliiroseovarius sp. 2305UL8-7]|uniref:TadE/TadG family type IV pilus assembly protein n=1 Tax=Aliiroseovarius conchicola TaxID=3121637 RepID=UPI003528310D